MKRLYWSLCAVILFSTLWGGLAAANQLQEKIKWSAVKTAAYDPVHPHTLNWSGDPLDRGGLSLSKLELTSSSSEADIVINQYGAMGARGILKLTGEKLEDATTRVSSGFISSVTLEKGALYLVKLHDDSIAKIRIDSVSGASSVTKVSFSYVIEDSTIPSAMPEAEKPSKQGEEQAAQQGKAPGTTQSSVPTGASQSSAGADTNQRWSDNYDVPGYVYKWPFSIYFTLDSDIASVHQNNKQTDYRLPTAPFLSEGRTMVPLRFIGEALGAKVDWNDKDQSIKLTKGTEKEILLQVNNKQAIVNGKSYQLDAPPIINGGSTVVPLRFVSEHLDMIVYFNKGRILITDTENEFFEVISEALAPPPGSASTTSPTTTPPTTDASFFYGKWDLWVPGGYAPTSSTTNWDGSTTVTNTYTPGAAADWIEIRKDGTYTWKDLGKTYEGSWFGDNNLITLYGGPMDSDWNMRKESDTDAKIFAWGLEYKASKSSK